jgi:glutaredoxin
MRAPSSNNRRPLKITEYALRKAQRWAGKVVECFGPNECMMFGVSDPQSDVVVDVVLPSGQRVTPTSVRIDGQQVLAVGREVQRLGMRIIAWIHSHANMCPFHSHTDDANAEETLNQIAPSNLFYEDEEIILSVVEGRFFLKCGLETLELFSADEGQPEQHLINISELRLRRKLPVGFAYSLVVNARGDTPYAEMYTKRWCPHCGHETVEKQQVELDVIPELDEAEMIEEIKTKISPAPTIPMTLVEQPGDAPASRPWLRFPWRKRNTNGG